MKKLAFENVLLLGDSACQVKATTGGGIVMLLTAGKYAAYCIKKCFKHKKFSRRIIKKYYESPCKIQIGGELKIHYLIRMILEKCTKKDFVRIFKIIKTSRIEKLISIYGDMDFPRAFIFKIIRSPVFISFLIRFLIKNPEILLKAVLII
jgi:flavin-dependent dehydrogenase